jgi:hypothetical protein
MFGYVCLLLFCYWVWLFMFGCKSMTTWTNSVNNTNRYLRVVVKGSNLCDDITITYEKKPLTKIYSDSKEAIFDFDFDNKI